MKFVAKKPKTAYGLLRAIQKVMREEPRRVYMGEWLVQGKDNIRHRFAEDFNAPTCNTVGCIAGWGKVLAKPRSKEDPDTLMAKLLGFTGEIMNPQSRLGSYVASNEQNAPNLAPLFYPETWPEDLKIKLYQHSRGTEGYVAIVCERIDRFIGEHEAHLRRQRI
jgi:hypothetical protein